MPRGFFDHTAASILIESMLRSLLWSLLWVLQLAFVACARDDGAHANLIAVEAVEQRWERAGQLFVRGEGFPQGMRGEARLSGQVFPPGEKARAIDVTLPCRALAKNEAVIALNEGLPSAGASGPFEGDLELSFGTREEGRLMGRLDQVVARLGSPPTLEQQFQSRQRAQAFQRSVGIQALLLGEHGVSVAELAPEGAAAKAGLKQGDVVQRLDGRPIQLPLDLVPSTTTDTVRLEVRRGEQPGTALVVEIGLVPDAPPLLWTLLTLAFALGASIGALASRSLPAGPRFSLRRKESWLAGCSALSLLALSAILVELLAPILRDACRAFALGAVGAAVVVCFLRRVRPTSRTERDPALAPLL